MTPILLDFARKSGFTLCKEESALREMLEQFAKFIIEHEALKQPAPVQPVANQIIAGALFDFMGWLTSRNERLILSSTDNASPAVEAITEFAKMRGLSLDDARVQGWQDTTPPAQEIVCSTGLCHYKAQPAPVQEPVAWMYPDDYERILTSETFCTVYSVEVGSATRGESSVALYTTPPAAQRQWVGLTDDEILKLAYPIRWQEVDDFEADKAVNFAQAIEAKLKEKNT